VTQQRAANLRGPHDLGEIIGYGYRIYIANFSALFLLALLFAPPQMLAVIADRRIHSDSAAQNVVALIQLLGSFVTVLVVASVIHAVNDVTDGTPADFGRSLDAAIERFGALMATALLLVGLLLASLLAAPALAVYWLVRRDATIDGRRDWWLALIPGVLFAYLVVRWAFALPAVMIDDRRNWSALNASAAIARGMIWRVAGILLAIGLIQLGPLLLASASMLAAPIVEGLITSGVSALILPFGVAAQTLLYYDLKARHAVDDARPAGIDDPEPDVPREGA
jgi:hypothetical protein